MLPMRYSHRDNFAPLARLAWPDAARGMGILLIVLGHVERELLSLGLASGPVWNGMDYAIHCFHMPLFFFLFGLNVPRSLEKKESPAFIKDKIGTLLFPCYLWSLIQGGLQSAFAAQTNGDAGAGDLLAIPWQPIGQFWFLLALFGMWILALLFKKRDKAFLLVAVLAYVFGVALPLPGVLGGLAWGMIFFAAGMRLSSGLSHATFEHFRVKQARHPRDGGGPRFKSIDYKQGNFKAWMPAFAGMTHQLGGVMFLVAMLILYCVTAVAGFYLSQDSRSIFALPAAFSGIAVAILLWQKIKGPLHELFAALGRMAMSIFVMHVIAASGCRIILQRLGVEDAPLLLVFCTVAGIILPALAHAALARAGLLAFFGLAPLPRKPAASRT